MKRTYLARRNVLLSEDVSWGVLALAFAILMLFVRLLAPDLFWKAFTPLFHASSALSRESNAIFDSFGDTAMLAAANEKLVAGNAALVLENRSLQAKLAGIAALSGGKISPEIIAGVVARPPESPYDTLVLAAGKKEGVTRGMEAFGESGVPIGVVSAVLDGFSRVTLFTAAGASTSGWVGRANAPITIIGAGGGALSASAPRAADIAIGDLVSVPGPGMLPIGSVVRIDSDPLSSAVTLRILPAVNLFSTTWVGLRATGIVPMSFATSTEP